MAILLSLNDIDDVLLHLSYANPTAQKYRLIQSIRQCYGGSDPAAFPSAIDAAVLVKALWDTGNDHILIKNKRKNLSSLKSAVNGDLKRLYKDGVISQGIIINRHNTFDLSDEAKNDTLSTLARNLGAEKEDVKGMSAKITEVLTIIRQVLSAQDVLSGKGNVGGLHDMEEVKQLLQYLSRQIDGIEGGITGATNAHTQTNDGGLLASSAARSVDAAGSSNAPIDDSAAIHAAGLGVTTFGPASTDNSSHLETGAPVSEDTSQILSDLAGIASPAPAQTSASGPETGSATFADAGTPTEQDFDTEAVLEAVEAEEEDLVENIIEDTNLEMAPVSSSGAPLEAFATEESTGLDGEVAGTGGPESNILNVPSEGSHRDQDVAAVTAFDSDELVEAVIEEAIDENNPNDAEPTSSVNEIEDDLRSRTELLSELAEAAKILENLGPDFNDSVLSEEEIREKARRLSEEFDRHLTIRDMFFNQHLFIKGGNFITGSRQPKENDLPRQSCHLTSFYIGKFPVTNGLFETFIEFTGYKTTAERSGCGLVYSGRGHTIIDRITGKERFIWSGTQKCKLVKGACWYHPSGPGSSIHDKKRHPVVQVSLEDARVFAAWTGKRLPTEQEWEAAARTHHGYLFPWGNDWKTKACNVEGSYLGGTTAADRYLEFRNIDGLADTLGNVLEWTSDIWTSPNTGQRDREYYVAKGGSWLSNGTLSLCSRFRIEQNISSNILGFRCIVI